jgi:hypothetical protein
MALGPISIGNSSARRDLPSAAYNPGQVDARSFGGAPAAALQQAGQALGQFAEVEHQLDLAALQEQKRVAEFNRETEFVDFASTQATTLAERARALSGDAMGFTKSTMEDFDASSAEFLARVPEDERPGWQARVAKLRAGQSAQALMTEFGQRDTHFRTQISVQQDTYLNGIAQTPDAVDAYVSQGENLIDLSGLSASEKETQKAAWRQKAAFAYGAAVAERDPAALIRSLGGPVTEAGDFTLDGAAKPAEKQGVEFFRSQGLSGAATAGVVGVLSHEGAGMNPNARNPGDGRDGSDSIGIAQWNAERATALKSFAASKGKPWNDLGVQLEFVLHEMKTGDANARKAYRMLRDADTVEEAVEAMNYYERPAGWEPGGDPTKVAGWADRVARGKRIAGTRAEATSEDAPPPATDPRLAALSFEDRMRLRGAAERTLQAEALEADRAEQAAQEERINALELRILDGKGGREDIAAARAEGWLEDASDVSRLTNIVETRERATADLTNFNSALATPGFVWNPYDDTQRDAVEAGVKARGGTAMAAFEVWQKTGILAPSGGTAIRGGLASQDPAVVQATANIASNMLARNPGAFIGVEGENEIEEAAVMFNHLVNELGYTADVAGQRIAQMNDPEYRRRVKVAEPEAADFRKRLAKEDPTKAIAQAVGGAPGFFRMGATMGIGADQRRAINADYAELAADHYARYGDEKAAKAFALQRMGRLYGVSNGVVVKYPPERVYPAVNGNHKWLYAQAAEDVKKATGRDIPADRVFLMPLPTVTAEAWRSGKQTPYAVHYIDIVDGQQVYRVLNGSAFVGDPREGLGAQSERTRRQFENRRRYNEMRRNPLFIVPGP